MRKCNLIIDTACDLPQEYIKADGVTLLRLSYAIDGVSFEDDMFCEQTPHDFYEKIRKGKTPTTSQVSFESFINIFKKAVESGVPTVYLGFTSALSGTFNTASLVRDQIVEQNPGVELYVVDTKLPSIAEGLFVIEAINQMNAGLTATEMVKWANEARYFIDAQFMVDDLESLKRGGRIPASVAIAGSKLDVKPILTINSDGGLKLVGVARGRKKGVRQLADYFEKRIPDLTSAGTVVIGDADCPKESDKLRDLLLKQNNSLLIVQTNVGPVIGSHVGPGMIAVAFWGRDRRESMSITDRIAKKVKSEN